VRLAEFVLTVAICGFLSVFVSPPAAEAKDNKPPAPTWPPLAEDEEYVIQVHYPTDSSGHKITQQITLNKKDCERNGNRVEEKENANSLVTAECHADGSILIQRTTLKPIGLGKQELNLLPVGTSRFEFLQGGKSYPDIKINVNRLKHVQP